MPLQIPQTIDSVIRYNLEIYLFDHLAKLPPKSHETAKNAFDTDIKNILIFCKTLNFTLLTPEIIKEIHRTLYPAGYVQKSKNAQGKEFIWMIPGIYRTIELSSKETQKSPYSNSENIPELISKLVASFNLEITQIQATYSESNAEGINIFKQQKKDTITRFTLDLVKIHPFGDGNGRVAGILSDILYITHGLEPIGLLRCYKLHKIAFTKILTEGNSKKNLQKLYEFAENNQN